MDALANGDGAQRRDAIASLRASADGIAQAPDLIRGGVSDTRFLEQAGPWLDAMSLWGRALQATAAGLAAADQESPAALGHFAEATALAGEASHAHTIAGTTRPQGSLAIGDGVLDRFISAAPGLIASAHGRVSTTIDLTSTSPSARYH